MSYMTKESIINRLHNHQSMADDYGEVFATFLQGSQNYTHDLNDPDSDVDSTVIIVPDFTSFCLNRQPVSTTRKMENDEHVNIKDIREFIKLLMKSNINTLELLHTEYVIVNPKYQKFYDILIENRESIAHYDVNRLVSSTRGMAFSAYTTFKKSINPESTTYDGKALAHLVRLHDFLVAFSANAPMNQCLRASSGDYLYNIKRNNYHTLDEAKSIAQAYIDQIEEMYRDLLQGDLSKNKETMNQFDRLLINLFTYQFKDDILKIEDWSQDSDV